jgi:hypothetical protein
MILNLSKQEMSDDIYNKIFTTEEGQEPLTDITKEQMINSTNKFFLKLERENAANVYEINLKKYEDQQKEKESQE